MDYDEWIERERRMRISLLKDSPVIKEKSIYRICQDCGEICLCHEETCPNCNSIRIIQDMLHDKDIEVLIGKRIRCKFRFEHLV